MIPERHCKCKEQLVASLMAVAVKIGSATLQDQLEKLRNRVMPGCPGTELPPIHYEPMKVAVAAVIRKRLSADLEGMMHYAGADDDFDIVDEIFTTFEEKNTLNNLADSIVGSFKQILEITLQGKLPGHVTVN